MTDTSARLKLPFLVPGQAQKEFFHNEALARIDMVLCAAVEGEPLAVPPPSPQPGQSWIVADGASGAWTGQDKALACWTDGGWRFVAPVPGMRIWNKDSLLFQLWDGIRWGDGSVHVAKVIISGKQIVGQRRPAIQNPTGGGVVDAEARAAIAAICAALMSHGLTD